ncbi:MAG: hypothetical protein WAO83_03290 [Fuerstiella sp.]
MRTHTPVNGSTSQSERNFERRTDVGTCASIACRNTLVTMVLTFAFAMTSTAWAQECGCSPAESYAGGYYSGGSAGQLFPYDQQDTWLHGQHQRVPSYGGYGSFRPYNYRHVAPQAQIASGWGATHGMTYSQQFFNKYRNSYLDGNLQANVGNNAHGQNVQTGQPQTGTPPFAGLVSFPRVQPNTEHAAPLLSPILQQSSLKPQRSVAVPSGPPIHVYPASATLRN